MDTSSSPRRSHALRGALLLAAVVSPAVLGLAALGIARNQPPLLEAAFRLTVLVLASGAVSGAVYDATRGMRGRGALARAISWWLVGGIAAVLLLAALRVFLLPLLAPGSTDAAYAMYITGPAGFKFLGAGVLLFGWAMADATADAALPGARIAGSGRALMVVALVGIVWAIGNLAGAPPAHRALPENAVEARRMIAEATRDARANPNDGDAQFAYGLCLMYLKRNAEARPVLARAESMLPDQAWPSNALGWVLLEEKDYAGALPHFQRAVRLDPDYPAATENLAWTYTRLGRLTEAEEAYGKAVRLAPREATVAADYAYALFADRKTDRAIAQIYRAIKLDSTVASYHAAAGYFLRSKARFADARSEFGRAAELAPKVASTWVQLGVTDFLMGDARAADDAFRNAVRRDSSAIPPNSDFARMWQSARRGKTGSVERRDSVVFQVESTTTASH